MTELTDLNDTDALNTAVTGQSTEGNTANMGGMDNLFQATLGMLSRFRNANIFRLRDNTDKTKLLAFDLSGLTTATTRTLKVPNQSGTMAVAAANGDLTLTANDDGAAALPNLILYRNSASPAVSDVLGAVIWRGKDNGGNDQDYANIVPVINDQTSTSEDAELRLQTVAAGTVGDRLVVRGGSGVYSYFSGDLLVGKSTASNTDPGAIISSTFGAVVTVGAGASQAMMLNRQGDDGTLISFRQANVEEGAISVSGTTVTYGSFCGAHWSQLADDTHPDLLRGTILDTIDDMCAWPGEENDQLARFKVSDTAGSASVYGVFCNWTEKGDANIASLGAFLVRINAGVTVSRGDLIESNGDGTGRVQSDDVIRSRTVAKVTSSHVVETFADGSYLVPCTLHCG